MSLLPGIGRARYHWLSCCMWLSWVVVDWTIMSGNVDMRAHLFIDHHYINFFIRVLIIFTVALDHEIILTAKYYFHDLWYITANKVAQMSCTISRENYYSLIKRSGWSGTLYQLPISTSKLIGVWLVYHLEYHNIVILYNFGINLLTLAWTFLLS